LELSSLRVDSTSGVVKLDNALAYDIHLSSTSGTLDLGNLQANQIRLETTSGSVTCAELNGYVTLEFAFKATTKNVLLCSIFIFYHMLKDYSGKT